MESCHAKAPALLWCNCRRGRDNGKSWCNIKKVWRLSFGVWRLVFGVWRLVFGVWLNYPAMFFSFMGE